MEVIRWDTPSKLIILRHRSTLEPIDLTGSTVYFTVRPKNTMSDEDDNSAIIQKIITNHTDPEAGQTTIELDVEDTSHPIGNYKYDIQIKWSNWTIESIKPQVFTILNDVTKDYE